MRNLAKIFVMEKNRVHGEDFWALMFCDNLSAHLDQDVKTIFGIGKVWFFSFYFPPSPNMKHLIQLIDAM